METYKALDAVSVQYKDISNDAMAYYCQNNKSFLSAVMFWKKSCIEPRVLRGFRYAEEALDVATLSRLKLLRDTVPYFDINNALYDHFKSCQEVQSFCDLVGYKQNLQCKQLSQ